MSLIKIIANDIELDVVKETLTISRENNAMINDFKVSYSQYPFLIVENSNTLKALGSRDITSINKPKIIDVTVEELGEKFFGELQVISYLNGFRKVTIKYSSEIISLMNKKISEFMPIVSVIPGELNPVPYSEESDTVISGYLNWQSYPVNFISNSFPNVKWQFPTMSWKNKFGKFLEPTNEWFTYQNEINKFEENLNSFIINDFTEVTPNVFTSQNKNVCSPQIYLLAPLFYALESINWKPSGSFVNSSFIKKILMLSTKNNLCKSMINGPLSLIDFNRFDWYIAANGQWAKRDEIQVNGGNQFKIEYDFDLISTDNAMLNVVWFNGSEILGQTIFAQKNTRQTGVFFLNAVLGNPNVRFFFYNNTQSIPSNYVLKFNPVKEDFYQMHPTIDTGRYLPDWTFGTYLNEIKKMFNVKFSENNFLNKLEIDFNTDYLISNSKAVLNKSLDILDYEQSSFNAFLIKFGNDQDVSLWVEKNETSIFTNQTSDFKQEIQNKFKYVNVNNYTAELSDELESKEGVGLMIYDENIKPYISSSYQNQTLKLEDAGGIYDIYWKKWLKFRLNASVIEIEGPFTEIELSKIIYANKIYIDNQDFIIENVNYSETIQDNFIVKFRLHSVNF